MLALMLDPHFKYLRIVESFVRRGNALCFAIEYDVKELIPFLMNVFDWMNPIVEIVVAPCDEPNVQILKKENNMFGVEVSMEEFSQALVITKLFLFYRLFISQSMNVGSD
jgi:hypothetical protein